MYDMCVYISKQKKFFFITKTLSNYLTKDHCFVFRPFRKRKGWGNAKNFNENAKKINEAIYIFFRIKATHRVLLNKKTLVTKQRQKPEDAIRPSRG